jgi:hypothetical protein
MSLIRPGNDVCLRHSAAAEVNLNPTIPLIISPMQTSLPIEILLSRLYSEPRRPRRLHDRGPCPFLERMFQNRSKILVKRRERDLHDVFQRLSILRRLRHELKTLQAAIEESRDCTEVFSFLELAIFPSAQ